MLEPAGTVTDAGTFRPGSPALPKVTVIAETVTAFDSVTVHVLLTFGVNVAGLHWSEETTGGASSDKTVDWEVELAVAVRVAFWSATTPPARAVKLAAVEPAATVTDVGTVRLELLLARLTDAPLAGAAESSVTTQLEEAGPCRDAGA